MKLRWKYLAGAAFLALASCKAGGGGAEAPAGEGGSPPPSQGEQPAPNAPQGPVVSVDPLDDQDAVRFLMQASFGGSPDDVTALKGKGIPTWLSEQVSAPSVSYQKRAMEIAGDKWIGDGTLQALFWERAIHGEDQLRQRMSFALSQIVVASMLDPGLRGRAREFSVYLDILQDHALGNYCDMLREVSLSPVMGTYLTHLGNRKADEVTGFVPDENYAREIMQLFTIGLVELNRGGVPTTEETYTIEDVQGLAQIFTGLSWADTDFYRPSVTDYNRYLPMEAFTFQHEEKAKAFLGTTIDLGSDAIISVEAALDHLLEHPNVAPFIARQLIQKLVTSNPSPAYVERVAGAFDSGMVRFADGTTIGTGSRCDLAATAAAILADPEARGVPSDPNFGKIRSPILRLAHLLRAVRVPQSVTTSGDQPAAWGLDNLEDASKFGMNAFVSPSVFNFYRPGYVAPGTDSAAAGLVTPEFQAAITPTLVGYINTMEEFIDGASLKDGAVNVANIDYAPLWAIADNSDALVDEIDRIFLAGMLSASNRSEIRAAVELIEIKDEERDRKRRVEIALLMAVVSPEFVVQR